MHIQIKWLPLIIFIAIVLIVATFGGLAGYLSYIISAALPVYAVISLVYVAASYKMLAWHQAFSTNHPQKGERILFKISLANDGFFPLASGICKFTVPGHHSDLKLPTGFLPGTRKTIEYETEISCPYRGAYVAGIESIRISTPLEIVSVEIKIEPQIFYVYPELCEIDSSAEKYAMSSGAVAPSLDHGAGDISIFEYAMPIRGETRGTRIAWKKWAATGIPSEIISGHSRSKGISVILDLFPVGRAQAAGNTGAVLKGIPEEERLAAEDIAASAAYSIVRFLSSREIPVVFITGGASSGVLTDNFDSFRILFERSTGVFFTDESFPYAAFDSAFSAILITTRPLSLLYSEYEHSLYGGNEPHLFACPPASFYAEEKHHGEIIQEQRLSCGSHSLFFIADVRNGVKEISDAFKA